MLKTKFIENRHAFERVACTMALYTRFKGQVPEAACAELRERRRALRGYRERWKTAHTLPCGHQDHLADNLGEAYVRFASMLDAMRLLRGRVSPGLQMQAAYALGEA